MNFIRLKKNNSKIAIMNDFCFALDFFFWRDCSAQRK